MKILPVILTTLQKLYCQGKVKLDLSDNILEGREIIIIYQNSFVRPITNGFRGNDIPLILTRLQKSSYVTNVTNHVLAPTYFEKSFIKLMIKF